MKGPNYITPDGFAKLKGELHQLLHIERPRLVETVAWAASNGDRSENADYIYGKKRLREIDKRVRFLEGRLDIAQVVDPKVQRGKTILFGATVVVQDENDLRKTLQIVGVDEIDVEAGKISWQSPIGRALLRAKQGDSVVVSTPRGEEEFLIVEVVYR